MAQVVGGVQAPKYIYLPNATVRYNKLTYTYTKTTTFNDTYTRPSDWLTLPEVNNGDEVVYMLVAVYENDPNYIGLSVRGDFTIDWGNGDIQNYDEITSLGLASRINYSFNWNDFDESTITSEGYKQAIVKITPQVSGTLTKFDIYNVYQSPFGYNYSGILDIKMAGQNINYLRIGGSYNNKLEQFEFVGSHNIINGDSVFYDSNIKKLVSFDMTNVTSSSNMFYSCNNLIDLPSNFDTSNVVNTSTMFRYCTSLEKVTLDLSSCTNASTMFTDCTNLKQINLTNTSNVTNTQDMFQNCSNLETITGLDMSSSTTAFRMFNNCYKLIDVPLLNLQSCTNMLNMFYGCSSIIRFENGLINTSGVTSMNSCFYGCTSLIEIPKDFDTSSVTDMNSMFYGCSSLRKIPLLNTSNVTNMSNMFYACGLIELPEGFNTSSVIHMYQMFRYCALEKVTLDLSSCTNASTMFANMSKIKQINLTNTSNVTNTQDMFQGCPNLETITGLDMSSSTTAFRMFQNCYKLIDVPLLNLQSCTNMYLMFAGCSSLEGFPNGLINTQNVTNMNSCFASCTSLKELPSNFNTDSCIDMQSMFSSTTSLKTIPSINTSNITSGYYMFRGSGIEELPSLDFSNITDSREMFRYCTFLRVINTIDFSKVTNAVNTIGSNFKINKSNILGLRYTHSYISNSLSRTELINIFNNLGNATSQTIDVRYNPGTADLTPTDIAIATSKGWTVTV